MTQAIATSPISAADGRASVAGEVSSARWIVSRAYDGALFLGAPAIALVAAAALAFAGVADRVFWLGGERVGYVDVAIGTLINAHLVAVFARSHGNADIRRRHPIRFFVVPPLVLGAMVVSETFLVVATVVAAFWDVYHSALQTFGFARMYDARAGNDPRAGRRLDLALNVVLYVGPILAGASLLAHAHELDALEDVGIGFLSSVPTALDGVRGRIAAVVVAGAVAFLVYYVAAYVRLARRGHRVAWPKVVLLATTGLCSIVAWGFDPWGLAFFVMNFFHAVQYLALVGWAEGGRMKRRARLGGATPFVLLAAVLGYGAWAYLATPDRRWSWAIAQTVALMHFWYDGFVWSVRKRDVT